MIRFAVALLLFAGSHLSSAQEPTRRERGDLAIKSRAILNRYCGECHGANPAPSALSVLNHGQLVQTQTPVPWVNLMEATRSQVIEFIEDGSMPPGGRPRPNAEELETLKAWIRAKAPSYPKAFDDATTCSIILDDLDRLDAATRPFVRYLSFAHLVRDDEPLPKMAELEFRLQKAILASSVQGDAPVPVDGTATLYRLDLRKLQWNAPDLFERIENQKPSGVFPIVPFDLILNEYPPSFYDAKAGETDPRLKAALAEWRQIRPVLYLRADWFAENLSFGKPLAVDMQSLTKLANSLNAKERLPCGPVPRPFLSERALAGAEPLPSPPLTSWYGGSTLEDPYGLKASIVLPLKGSKPASDVEVDEPFRIRIEGKRDVRILMLNILAAGDIRVQPIDGGNIVKAGETRLLGPSKGQTFKSGSILTGGDSETEHYVILGSETSMPNPTIIRSVHSDLEECRRKNQQPVWRFVYEKLPADFDSSKAVRVVLPLTIHKKS